MKDKTLPICVAILFIGVFIASVVYHGDSNYLVSYSRTSKTNEQFGHRIFITKEMSINEVNKILLLLEGEQTNSTVVILSIYKLSQ